MPSLEKWAPVVLSLARIVAALLFIEHGLQKFFAFPSAGPPTMSTLLWIQGAIEIFGGLALLVGLFTRPVAFVLSGDMAFAYFMAHFPRSFYPAVNGGDAAVLFCFIFLYFAFVGAGPWSLDETALKRG